MGAYKDYCFWGKAWSMHEKQSHCIGHCIAETEASLACVTLGFAHASRNKAILDSSRAPVSLKKMITNIDRKAQMTKVGIPFPFSNCSWLPSDRAVIFFC